jgi:hypothetical protein
MLLLHLRPWRLLPRLPKDIRETLGPLGEKRKLYYADFPPELMEEMWRCFKLALRSGA